MKKGFIVIIIVAAVLAVGVAAVVFSWKTDYDGIKASDIPVTPVNVGGQEVWPASASVTVPLLTEWQEKIPWAFDLMEPALGDYYYKHLSCVYEGEAWSAVAEPEDSAPDIEYPDTSLGLLGEVPFLLVVETPDTMAWAINLFYEDDKDGSVTPVPLGDGPGTILLDVGNYTMSFAGTLAGDERAGISGSFEYGVCFSIKYPDPVFSAGRAELAQGDILSMMFENVPDGLVPELETELGPAIFTKGNPLSPATDEAGEVDVLAALGPPEGFSNWYAAVPIAHNRKPGEYMVTVSAGEIKNEIIVTVSEFEFDFQNMIIDTSVPSVAEATSSRAIEEFREKISPLIPIISEERYWDGIFIMPVDLGDEWSISTQFGEIRITNGDQSTSRSHLGMDLAVPTGTPVHATNGGIVLLAEFLLNTGNTVIIDHGGGLKSFYYHMDSVETEAGLVIERGTLIGTVGTTGYSTGPHLHFEMRIGEQPISPSMLFEPDAGLYSVLR